MKTRLTNAQSLMKNSEKTASIRPGTSRDPEARINVLFLCDEWKSSKGGLSTFNRELAVNLAKSSSERIIVHCYVPQSDELDIEDAREHGVNLFTAQRIPGSTDPLECLKIPPPHEVHVVIGHGRKFGVPAYFIANNTKCKWIQFLHVFCEDLGKYKWAKRSTEDTIDENEDKHRHEKELCEAADLVVGVGSSLQTKYQKCLPRGINVQVLTPGIFESFAPPLPELRSLGGPVPDHDQDAEFSVFMFSRLTFEDISVKGFDVIARAIASLGEGFKLTIVGSPPAKQRRMEEWFLSETKITREQLTIRRYCDQQELKGMFQEAHLVALPSNAEGFGLVALEAISAAVPVLVSKQSGIAKALENVETGGSVVVTSQKPQEWARKILQLSKQTLQERSENAIQLRENYNSTYSWKAQCERFESMIVSVLEGMRAICPSSNNLRSGVFFWEEKGAKRGRGKKSRLIHLFEANPTAP